ncbi:hypothetical protein CHARACLAT_018065 [Characodon lateralis]|uniref:Uncharacterized protein n=1 Tax=Characodon lateralis TaxID=208331 RepID=A0ABU7EK24_9TELE|nr:hypothetical protein [Characodon lateralis]
MSYRSGGEQEGRTAQGPLSNTGSVLFTCRPPLHSYVCSSMPTGSRANHAGRLPECRCPQQEDEEDGSLPSREEELDSRSGF